MKFLNKKEQVIDLQLTQYGKHLLSNGVFKPVYYSFFDDNILYDGQYGGVTGSQNDIQTRITTDTPQLEVQHVFRGIETEVKKSIKEIRSSQEYKNMIHNPDQKPPPMIQPTGDKLYGLQYPIGTSELNSTYAPAWKIEFLQGRLSSSATSLTGAYSPINIPQLESYNVEYKTLVRELQDDEIAPSDAVIFGSNPSTFLDVIVDEGSILLQVDELHAFFGQDNFEIEVYEIEQEQIISGTVGPVNNRTTQKEIYNPLYFIKPKKQSDGNILLDSTPLADMEPFEGTSSELDPSYVEYFLEINVDNEIDEETLCKYAVDRSQGIFSSKALDCQKAEKAQKIDAQNIFNTDVTEEDLGGCDDDTVD